LNNEYGSFKKTFIGEECGKDLLKFISHEAIIFFQNLGYESRFIDKNVVVENDIKKSKSKIISLRILFNK